MRQRLEYFDLSEYRGGDAPISRMVEANLFEGHVRRGGGGGDGTSLVDLTVGPFSDLIEADVVGDGACGERPAV